MAGKKKHKLRKQYPKDAGQECYSSGEDSEIDCSGKTCPHLTKSVNMQSVKKVFKGNLNFKKCQVCSVTEPELDITEDNGGLTLWLCLQCGNIGCGRYSVGQHAIAHYQTPRSDSHALCLNLSSWSVWCYDCDEDVMPDSNKKLLECVEFLKKHVKPPSITNVVVPVVGNIECPNQDFISGSKPNSIAEESPNENGGKVSTDKTNERSRKLSNNPDIIDNLPKVKGLVNLGNTCFFNAVLQSLSQTHILSQLIDLQCIRSVALTLERNDPGVKASDVVEPLNITLSEGGPLTQSLAAFLKEINSMSRSSRTVNPGHLFGQVCKKAPQFRGMMQQDSHELLRHLLDGLKNEEMKRYKVGILKAFGLSEKINLKQVDNATRSSLKVYGKLVQQTLVDQVFSGQLISTVLCEECKMSSQVFEPFLDLSLPVMEEKPIRPNTAKKNAGDEAIVTCLEKVAEKPSKYQEKKAKKQAKREAKALRSKAKQQRRRTISIGEPISDNTGSPVQEGVPKVKIEADAESTNNSIETKNGSELSDADVEDNAESESISSLNTNAPAIVGGKKLTDDGCWLRDNDAEELGAELPFHESEEPEGAVDEICLKVKGLQVRQDSLPDVNGIVGSENSGTREETEDWKGYNGDIVANGHRGETKTGDEDKMWSSSDEDIVKGGGKKLAGHLSAKKEWVSKSMATLSPRYQVSSHECSVLSCLNQFTAPELLTGNNKFGCGNCTKVRDEERQEQQQQQQQQQQQRDKSSEVKAKETTIYTNASKQLLVVSPPAILTLHLKRFQQVGFSLRKVNRHIDFPLTLDLAPYCSLGLPTLKKGQQRVLYSLYAVVEHCGRLTGGHYTAYVKARQQRNSSKDFLNERPIGDCDIGRLMDQVHEKLTGDVVVTAAADEVFNEAGRWYHVSDGHVSESSETSVLKCQAYLLFYERVI